MRSLLAPCLLVVAILLTIPGVGRAQVNEDEKSAVRRSLEAFVDSFNKADAKAVAGMVTDRFEFIDDSGVTLQGKAEFEGMLGKYFAKNKDAKLHLTLDGVRVVSKEVALEDAESTITVPEKKAQTTRRVNIVFAKADGLWKLASIREFPEIAVPVSASERLKDLEFLVGDWIEESADAVVETTVSWAKDKKHLKLVFAVKTKGQTTLKGTQRIAVDPLTDQIKGWTFDSEGGYANSIWAKGADHWIVRASGVSSEGDGAGATHVIKLLAKDRIEWKSMHRVIGSDVVPDRTVVLVRKPAAPK